jgi:hypothetical protein
MAMVLKRLLNKIALALVIVGFLLVNSAPIPSDAIVSSAQQPNGPLFSNIENISIDAFENFIRLNGQENNANANHDNPQLFGIFGGIAADSSYAYIVDHVLYSGNPDVGLWIVDFFDPGGPSIKGFLNIQLANDVVVRGDYAYVVSGFTQFDHLLSIVDISDPTLPKLVSTIGLISEGMDVFVDGDYAYVALGSFGNGIFQVVNVSDPEAPFIVGTYSWGYGSAGVIEHEDIAYLADEFGLITLDVTYPNGLTLISELSIGVDDPTSVRLKKNIIYMTGESPAGVGTLYTVDMTVPSVPNLLNIYNMPEANARDIWILGNYGFVANDVAGLRTMDLSDPNNPVTLDIYDTSDTALDLAVADHYLYLAGSSSVYMFTLNLYSVNGRVIDKVGNPLNNFPVAAGISSDNITDANGYYTLDGLLEGDYIIHVETESGYHANPPEILVHVPPSTTLPDIVIEDNTVQGLVMAANHMPVSDVRIEVSNGRYALTDASGRYIVSELPEQTYTLVPSNSPWVFQPTSASLTIPPYHHWQNFWILPASQTIQLIPGTSAQITFQEIQGTDTVVQFPQDAVTVTTTVVLTPTLANGGMDNKFTGHAFDIAAFRGEEQLSEFFFNAPITITIEYSDYDLRAVTDEALLNMQTWDGSTWGEAALTCDPPLPYSYDFNANVIALSICQSGRFALFGPTNKISIPLLYKAP